MCLWPAKLYLCTLTFEFHLIFMCYKNYYFFDFFKNHLKGFPGTSGKEHACQCRRHKWLGFDPWVGKIPWRKAWQPTPAFLPGESNGQRRLAATVHGIAKSRHDWSDLANIAIIKTLKSILFLRCYLFIYFWLCWVFTAVLGLSLVSCSEQRLHFVEIRRLLIAVTSLIAEHRL